MSDASNVLSVFVAILTLFLVTMWRTLKKRRTYPPGPKGLPIVGNIFDMPKSEIWLTAARWKEDFGNIVFLEIFAKPIVFVNSYEAAVEILEKGAVKNSSRPRLTMLTELQGLDWHIGFMPYGERWRKHTAYLHRFFGSDPSIRHDEPISTCAVILLDDLLAFPEEFFQHIRAYVGSIIMALTYGHKTERTGDHYISLVEKSMAAAAPALEPGAFLVDVFPLLKYVPSWVPGAGFRRVGEHTSTLVKDSRSAPYRTAKAKVLNGSALSSMTSVLIEENLEKHGAIKNEEVIMNATGSVYLAAADTSVSALLTFVLAMVLYPEVQLRAQEEIDRVIGDSRMPTLQDKEKLPYVMALIDECLRWQPVAPMGIPHVQTHDEIYNGYFFPKGTAIVANIWLLLHDPVEYPEPHTFSPERFLPLDSTGKPKKMARDPKKVAFGFGRRACPGQQSAINVMFVAVSGILSAFNIEKAVDSYGNQVEVTPQYTQKPVNHPLPFKCRFRPRCTEKEVLIRQFLEST